MNTVFNKPEGEKKEKHVFFKVEWTDEDEVEYQKILVRQMNDYKKRLQNTEKWIKNFNK